MKVSIELYPCCCMTYGLVERFTNLYFTYMGVEALLQEIAVQDEWLHFLVVIVYSKSHRNANVAPDTYQGSWK